LHFFCFWFALSPVRRNNATGEQAKCSIHNAPGYFAGTVGNSNTNGSVQDNGSYGTYNGNTSTSQTAIYRVYQDFVIEGETYAYYAQEHIKWRWSKPANLTVNGTVKYAVDKRKLYVIDDDGKEHEMEIMKKVLRMPETAPK